MRILLASASSGSFGGGEKYLLILGEALKQQGHELALWCSTHTRMDDICRAFTRVGTVFRSEYTNTYDLWHRGLFRPTLSREQANRLQMEWLSWKPDIIHLNKQCLEDGLDLLDFASSLPLPLVVTIHITQTWVSIGSRLGGVRDWNARRCLQRKPRVLIAVSECSAKALQSFVGTGHRVVAIENGIPEACAAPREVTRRAEAIPDPCLAVVAVGRLNKQKRPLRFLSEIAHIRDAGIQVNARWLGASGPDYKWSGAIRNAGLQYIVRTDYWRDNIPSILPAFDLFLHTAAYEGLPFALLEALQAGLPCIVAEEVHEQLPADIRGCTIKLDSFFNWKDLLSQSEHLRALGIAGRELVARHYTAEGMATRHLALYSTLLHESC